MVVMMVCETARTTSSILYSCMRPDIATMAPVYERFREKNYGILLIRTASQPANNDNANTDEA